MDSCVKQTKYYPYNLMLVETSKDFSSNNRTFLCVASYIALHWAVTAASCFLNVTKPCVLIGGSQLTFLTEILGDPLQHRYVRNWIIHPKFNPHNNNLSHNVALIRLSNPFNLGGFVNVIKMFSYDELGGCDVRYLYESCSLLCAHSLAGMKSVADQKEVENMKRKWCRPYAVLDTSTHCSETKRLSNETCWHKIGSPLICEKKLFGFVIHTFVSATKCVYVFTRMDAFQDWFKLHIPLGLYYDKDTLIICDKQSVNNTLGKAVCNTMSERLLVFSVIIFFVLY